MNLSVVIRIGDGGLALVSVLPCNPSGRSLTGLIRADGLDAAARPGGRVTFGGQAGEDRGRSAAAPQQAPQGQRHSRPGHLSVRRAWGRGAGPVTGLRPPLRGRRAVQGHADGGRTNRSGDREGERGGGAEGVGDAGVDGEVGDGSGKAAQLWGQRATHASH